MAWIRKSDGRRVNVPDVDVWGVPLTPEEQALKAEQELQAQLDSIVNTSNKRDKALLLLIVDLYRAQNPGLTQQEALQAVRARLRVHLES